MILFNTPYPKGNTVDNQPPSEGLPPDHIAPSFSGGSARVTDIARHLGAASTTLTEMVQKLMDEGSVDCRKWRGVRLTSVGEESARPVLNKHSLL